METPSLTNEINKSDFRFYSYILAGAVVLGVVGYVYFSMDKNSKVKLAQLEPASSQLQPEP